MVQSSVVRAWRRGRMGRGSRTRRVASGGPRTRGARRPSLGLWVSLLAALTTAACSAAPAPPARSVPPQSLSGTSWIGACPRLAVGTFTVSFSPTPGLTGMARMTVPNPAASEKSARYSVGRDLEGDDILTMSLAPPWHGQFERDREDLDWVFVIGTSTVPYECHLTPETTLP